MSEMKSQLSLARIVPRSHLPIDRVMAAVFVLVALTAKPQQPALADSHKSDPLPKELKLYWRSVSSDGPISSVTVEWDTQALNYKVTRPASVKALNSDKRSIRPSQSSWKEFWKDMDEIEVWKWVNDYGTKPDSIEGRAWSVSIKRDSKKVKSSGTNAYPSLADVLKPTDSQPVFHRLWYAVDKLLGRPIEVKGTYLAGFEVSRFSPSTEEFKGQYWWLSSNEDFNKRYQRLMPKDQHNFRFAGPEVFARLRGRLVGPGRYGHLNQYTHEFIVEEVLEMKPAK
jgi:hypothetical protein